MDTKDPTTTTVQPVHDDVANGKLPETTAAELDMDEEDDGYKTPTSEDSKIPATRQCPPPPRPRSSSSKKIRVQRVLVFKM